MSKAPGLIALLLLIAVSTDLQQAQAASGTDAAPPAPRQRAADAPPVRALQSHEWTLQSATDAAGKPVEALLLPGHAFVLRFEGARLGIQGGCNLMSGSWRPGPQSTLVFGRIAATQKACEAPLMAADAAMAALLGKPLSARIEPGEAPTLRLGSPDGKALTFAGKRTTRSQSGKPERVFLEVAAQRVACTPALQPPATCLQVRERQFDDNGLPVGEPGAWQAFYGEIAGYTHQPGVSNVLRINRYKRRQPPADGSAYIYELDLVVESKVVDPK